MLSRLAAVLLVSGVAGSASAQPKVIEIKGAAIHPNQVEEIRKRLQEDVEMAAAQRDTKRELLKAAEVQLDVAKRKQAIVEKGNSSAAEKNDAQSAVDVAMAQVSVKKAELAEAELRIVHNKRRLDSGVFPLVLTPVPTPAVLPPAPPAPPPVKNKEESSKLPELLNTPKSPQSKLPARVGFPTPQNEFTLAQLDYEVANLRFEVAQVEVQQLQKLSITGEQIDAAKARYEEAKKGLHAAEDKVLKAQKKIDLFGK